MTRVTNVQTIIPIILLLLPLCLATLPENEQCPGDGVCDLSIVRPACGVDGITYQSSCLAACQDIAVAKLEPCKPADARQFTTATPSATAASLSPAQGSIDLFNMNRFRDEGFQFIGLGRIDADFQARAAVVKDGRSRYLPGKLSRAAVRFMPSTGYLYRSNAPSIAHSSSLPDEQNMTHPALPFTTSFDPTPLDKANRNSGDGKQRLLDDAAAPNYQGVNDSDAAQGKKLLAVFPPDERVRQTPTTDYPWSAVGLLQAGRRRCSAAMVSPTAAITAAECVAGGRGGTLANITFSPGADGRERPFGIVLAYHVTVYDAWEAGCRGNCTLERWYTNLAVVMFEQPVGSTVGFFGLAASDEFTINATIAGYPNDKPFGEMWRQACRVSDRNPNDFMTRTKVCDLESGQSGSAVWETKGSSIAVRAVVAATSPTANYLSTITTPRFWDLMRWSGGAFTKWNDADPTNGFRNIFLDRHDVSCTGYPGRGLAHFRLETFSDPYPILIRVRYQCSPFRDTGTNSASKALTTPANDWGGGNAIFIDRHDVVCPAHSVLIRWRLVRPTEGQIAIKYWCASANFDTSTCEGLTTPWGDNGGGRIIYLDRHSVACPAHKLLTRWRLEPGNFAGQYRIAFTCCGD